MGGEFKTPVVIDCSGGGGVRILSRCRCRYYDGWIDV